MKKIDLLNDIYYLKEYTSLYLTEGSTIFEFDYQDGTDRFYNLSIKRPINNGTDGGYFDLETAYGYGGYYCTTEDKGFLKKAFKAYSQKCINEQIIAEFVRFHPWNTFLSLDIMNLDFLAVDRQTVSIDLTPQKADRWLKYSSTTRNILRKASSNLCFLETDNIEEFMRLYQSTMKRNNAHAFYFFPKNYYEELLAIENVKLFSVEYDNQIINMSFVLFGKNLAHYHLSANNQNFSKLNGNYYFLDSMCDYLKQNYPSISEFHLGGGRSNLSNDSLLAFKTKFSQIRNNFFIAGKIFNHTVFQQYTDAFHLLHPELRSTKYFLKYRMEFA